MKQMSLSATGFERKTKRTRKRQFLDDWSHTSSDIIKAFADYFPLLEDDGLYIVEDLHCSYWARYQGGLKNEKSSMNFFKLIADILNKKHWIEEKDIDSFFNRFYYYFSIDLDESKK